MARPPPVALLAWYPELQLTVTLAPVTTVIKSGKTVPVPKIMCGFWQCCVEVLGGGGGALYGGGAGVYGDTVSCCWQVGIGGLNWPFWHVACWLCAVLGSWYPVAHNTVTCCKVVYVPCVGYRIRPKLYRGAVHSCPPWPCVLEMHTAVPGCQYVRRHWAVAKDGLLT